MAWLNDEMQGLDPEYELQDELNIYRKFVNCMEVWDAWEAGAYLDSRDGIQWALEQLDGQQVDEDILREIEELDEKLKSFADHLTNELKLFEQIYRDDPKEHWWWYLDELVRGKKNDS